MSGLFVKLDTNWPDHPKIMRAGIDGAGLHAITMAIAKRLNSDGWIDVMMLRRYGATDELVARLVRLGLLESDESGDNVRPSDWHERNPSKAELAAQRAAKAEAGRRGNHVKHLHPGEYGNCRICNPSQVVAGCEDRVSQGARGCEDTASPETETESVTASDRSGSHLGFAGPKPVAELATVRSLLSGGNDNPATGAVSV